MSDEATLVIAGILVKGTTDQCVRALLEQRSRVVPGVTKTEVAQSPQRAAGLQAPPARRRRRHPARLHPDRRQPQRRHAAAAPARRRAGAARPRRGAAATSRSPARRARLRPRPLPPRGPQAGDHAADWPPRHRPRLRPRSPALGGGAQHRLAAPLPPPAGPLRAPRRHPRGVPHPGLLHHLLPTIEGVIVKRVLSATGGS